MKQLKIIRFKGKLTKHANLVEMEYRDKIQGIKDERTNNIEKWLRKKFDGRLEYLPKLKQMGAAPYGKVLELGAGSCWFSSEISKVSSVQTVYAVEFSEYILTKIAPKIMDSYNANTDKIIRVLGDFNKLEFKNSFFDYVVFDAALHHAADTEQVLKETSRVLTNGGLLVAIREPTIPPLRYNFKEKFGKEDKDYGITENAYTLSQWRKILNGAGFEFKAIPFIPETSIIRRLLNIPPFTLLNILFLGHYIFVCKKLR